MAENCLDRPVSQLKGIGPAREAALAEKGIRVWKDLLLCLPRRFHVRPEPGPMASLNAGETGAAAGTIARVRVSGWGRRKHLRVWVEDGEQGLELFLFNRGYLKTSFKKGRTVTFHGKVTAKEGVRQLLSPDYHLEGDPGDGFPGLVPVYALPSPLFPRTFHRMIDVILAGLESEPVADWRSDSGLPDRDLLSLTEALRIVHRPASLEHAETARRRIAYEEFLAFQVGLGLRRAQRRSSDEPEKNRPALPPDLDKTFRSGLPFEPTAAQERAFQEIRKDLEAPAPMHRLLQGDVGSGKTAVALYPLLAAALSGRQGAFMAPTEVLASQHAEVLTRLLKPTGIEPVFLPAGLPTRSIHDMLTDPKALIVVGTHALIQERVTFRDLMVCVIDEQHKFGVRQRWNLKAKGCEPDVMVMTATPIPRSLALTLYGELDVTVLDELPPGRRPVVTEAVLDLDDPELSDWIDQEIVTGGRIFFVCPLVNESEHLDLEAAVKLHGTLKKRYGARCTVGLLHGGLSSAKKANAIDDFRDGKSQLLVTTVVVEVGVDVPQASTVVILDAWRFGLAQLHQIRGRVGRGDRPSRCYLVGTPNTHAGKQRLEILRETNNGFRIAEEDLKMRGPGEAMGLKQHGLPTLMAGDYLADLDLMTAARDDARQLLASGRSALLDELLFPVNGKDGLWIG